MREPSPNECHGSMPTKELVRGKKRRILILDFKNTSIEFIWG
jgi:hypothetical protein